MAGHSHFKNMMHRKGAQDARRARQFARLIREITVAAGQGLPDPAFNPRLRAAVAAARRGRTWLPGAVAVSRSLRFLDYSASGTWIGAPPGVASHRKGCTMAKFASLFGHRSIAGKLDGGADDVLRNVGLNQDLAEPGPEDNDDDCGGISGPAFFKHAG